jgi:hypothetical protein
MTVTPCPDWLQLAAAALGGVAAVVAAACLIAVNWRRL